MKFLIASFVPILMFMGMFFTSNPVHADTQIPQQTNRMVIKAYGKTYTLQANQEISIPIPGAKSNDPRIATTIHYRNNTPNSSVSTHSMINAYVSGCSLTAQYYENETNVWGTILISHNMQDWFCYGGGSVTSISRQVDSWYANSGLSWYYNTDQNYTTPTGSGYPDATDARAIKFTGPFWQQQNLVIRINVHQDGTFGSNNEICGGDWIWCS